MPPRRLSLAFLLASAAIQPLSAALDPADAYQPRNTQAPGQGPPPAAEAAAALKLPEGFKATLFAGDPDVRQPIDMKLDDRGRLWVCEAYAYKEWQKKGEDRILIFTDRNGDGVADERKVFHGGFNHLSSVEIGFGGVWVLDTPNLLFFPDKDGDDVPDGSPQVLLDGWTEKGQHNMVNGLIWGLDGWLYGRHGITNPSLVGPPGTPEDQRVFIEPGVWRYHPVTQAFEVVLKGMTNPWGLDWDDRGELFLSGNVNGHLWHGIPGALYERMFGAGSVPHDYERLRTIAERPHYRSTGNWQDDWKNPAKGRDATNDLGGGHSHCGLMIYQGDTWPERHRGSLFMNNTHGRRINEERVEPKAGSYLGRHAGDLMTTPNLWFRGVSRLYGPDGDVYVSDWCDNGECHDDDGVHRNSGRIYKIVYGAGKPEAVNQDLAKKSDAELAALMLSKNEWFVRHARRILEERALSGAEGGLDAAAVSQLRDLLKNGTDVSRQLRALWTLQACDLLKEDELLATSHAENEHLRAWAVRFMCEDFAPSDLERMRLVDMAQRDSSALVRVHLASVLQRVTADVRWPLTHALIQRAEAKDDHTFELMLWYGLEPRIPDDPKEAMKAYASSAFPLLQTFIARRLAAEADDPECREAVGQLLATIAADPNADAAGSRLAAMRQGLEGRKNVGAPENWTDISPRLAERFSADVAALGLAFGDASTLDRLRADVRDAAKPAADRLRSLQTLREAGVSDLRKILLDSLGDPVLRTDALRGLAQVADASVPALILKGYAGYSAGEKAAAIDALCARPASARALLDAVASRKVPRTDVTATHARQIDALGDKKLSAQLTKTWGAVKSSTAEKEALISKFRAQLTDVNAPAADRAAGKAVFTRVCATCHVLFGEGGHLGPDLTGGGRRDLDYLLRNVIDPSAVVPRDYKMTVVTLNSGEVLAGVVPQETDKTLTVQTLAERRTIERTQAAKIEHQDISWMPEGLLQSIPAQDVRDLIAYLRSDGK